MKFEWDTEKANINLKKHDVSFEEAQTVFDDAFAFIFDDKWSSVGEYRELIIGYSVKKRLLIVSFTERKTELIRIISSRLTTNYERKNYEQNRHS
jgi:uncharacterized DUF497 family protein